MNLKSREYQNILLFSSPCANTEAENSMNKSWTKISRNLNGFLKKVFMKILLQWLYPTSYPWRLEPHNLKLFRIHVTNRLEIFCETCSLMFSVLKLRKISHSMRALISIPAFYQVAQYRFPCWAVEWSGTVEITYPDQNLIVVFF